jgi:hypothetical protein
MNLRKVTIWTTGVMLIATLILPCRFFTIAPVQSFGTMQTFSFVWLTSGSPLVVSFILAKVLKYHISSIIILASTIAYSIWYICVLPTVFFEDFGVLVLLCVAILSLPVMIPAWIAAIVIEIRHRRKNVQKSESLENNHDQ